MAGDRPPGDGRGTRPAGQDPHRGRQFPPASDGTSRSYGQRTPPAGHRRQQTPNSDKPPGGRKNPGTWEEMPSAGQATGSNQQSDNTGWRHRWTDNAKQGYETFVLRFRQKFNFSRGLEKVESSRDLQKALYQELPRLQLYIQAVHGASLDREQETALLQQLDCLLKQVQACVKALDEEPFELDDVKAIPEDTHSIDRRASAPKSYKDAFSDLVSRLSGYSAPPLPGFRKSLVHPSEQDSQPLKKEDDNEELIKALHNFLAVGKRSIALFEESSNISPDSAKKLYSIVDCVDLNLEVVLRSQAHCFSLPGLIAKFILPANIGTVHGEIESFTNVLQSIVTIADCVVENIDTSPIQYDNIGKEARCILTDDFCLSKLKINSEPYKTVCVAIGAQKVGEEAAQRIMMKVKGHNMSLVLLAKSLDAQMPVAYPAHLENDIVSTKLSIEKICGKNLKCVLQCPFPSLNTKFKIQGTHPYCVYGGAIWLRRGYAGNPGNAELCRFSTLSFSGLLGVKSFGLGGKVSFDSEKGNMQCALGVDMRTKLCAVGFTMNQFGTCRGSFCKKLVDSTTTVAAKASYSSEAGAERGLKFTLGLKHGFDPDLYLKARAGTDGLGIALRKSGFAGRCTLKASAHFDLNKEWRQPKIGLVYSFSS